MHQHLHLGDTPFGRNRKLLALIVAGEVTLGGYSKSNIYGTLKCRPGKRMKPINRVFFKSEMEALQAGYRPCAHCMNYQYKLWKAGKAI